MYRKLIKISGGITIMIKNHVLISYGTSTGGVEILIYDKARWLIDHQHKVYFICSNYRGELYDEFKDIGIEIIEVDFEVLTLEAPIYKMFNLYSILRKELDGKDAIIETFGARLSITGVFLAKMLDSKFCSVVCHPKEYTDNFLYFPEQGYKEMLESLDKNNVLIWLDENKIKSHEDYYNMTIQNRNIVPVWFSMVANANKNVNSNSYIITYIGRLCDFKVGGLIQLISDVNKLYCEGEKNIELKIIGDGEETSRVKKVCEKTEVFRAGHVKLLGLVPHENLEKEMEGSLVIVAGGGSIIRAALQGYPSIVAPYYAESNKCNGYIYESIAELEMYNGSNATYYTLIKQLLNLTNEEYTAVALKCKESAIAGYIDNGGDTKLENFYNNLGYLGDINIDVLLDYEQRGRRQCIKVLSNTLKEIENSDRQLKVAIWGLGEIANDVFSLIQSTKNLEIVAAIDAYKNGMWQEMNISTPLYLAQIQLDIVIVTANNGKEMIHNILDRYALEHNIRTIYLY